MGLTVSTSLSKLGENAVLQKFVGTTPIKQNEGFWKELLTFSYVPPKSMQVELLIDNWDPICCSDSAIMHLVMLSSTFICEG